ncbi:MAG TPA: hypothetical protein PJ990_01645 [Saprospiraceae bacterium]|nr:hypothetical protein [Saprospiraceae bacterium]
MKCHIFPFLIIAFMLQFPQGIICQNELSDFYLKDKVGITVSSFLNNYQAVQFNFAKGIKENMDFNTELGYIYRAEKREDCKGFRIRLQPRFRISLNPNKFRAYASPLFQYRYTNSTVENIFSRFDGAYFQQITHTEVNNMFSLGIILGRFFRLSDHMYINLAFGLGLNFSTISFPDVPPDAKWQAEFKDIFFLSDDAYDYQDEGKYLVPLIIYHLNIFYKFS